MTEPNPDHIFANSFNGGEMSERMREIDWTRTALGAPSGWSPSLKTAVQIMLNSRYPMFIWWGAELVNLYNDAYIPVLGSRHPAGLGRNAGEIWKEIWQNLEAQVSAVMNEGKASWNEEVLLFLQRNNFIEECYFTWSYSPIVEPDGSIGGLFCACTEETAKVLGRRRLKTLHDLGERTPEAIKTTKHACRAAARSLSENPFDVPFALIYLLDEKGEARRMAEFGFEVSDESERKNPAVIEEDIWNFKKVLETNESLLVENLEEKFGDIPAGAWESDRTRRAVVVPLAKSGIQDAPAGFLVAGISPRLEFDPDYQGFLELVGGNIATSIANARAYEEEKRRAEALAEIDRAKTEFFSNVSHEFRTPLTLMLGNLEEILEKDSELPPVEKNRIETAHRNSLRLLKLVNNLLDFSQIEANRQQADFRPVDLSLLTEDLASNFHSAVEKAGMNLSIDCPPLSKKIPVDRDMWEKIVLNLLSNAYKFTFEGEIKVSLRERGESVELIVEDTGVGIPAEDLPHVFERFHRVRSTQGRTHEGTGIGLALVRELVKMHAGDIRVASEIGRGTSFTVTIPKHRKIEELPPDGIESDSEAETNFVRTEIAAKDSPAPPSLRQGYLTDFDSHAAPQFDFKSEPAKENGAASDHPTILLADDNSDMRRYVLRLLVKNGFEVQTVSDGQAALEVLKEITPDLILSDVMMPRLDGFSLLEKIRENKKTREIPVILLSARAGEESKVEGLAAGADDYLIKPFAAKELIARVESHLRLSRLRREAKERIGEILDSITDCFMALDENWNFVYFNSSAEKYFGRKRGEVLGGNIWELFPQLVGSRFEEKYREAFATGEVVRFEGRSVIKENVWVQIDAYPSENGLSIYFRDVTERKIVRDKLRESEKRFRHMADNAPVMVWVTAADASCTYLSQSWYEFTGQTPETGLGFGWLEAVHPDDREMSGQIFLNANERREGFQLEYRLRRRDGEYRWAIDSAQPRLSESGDFLGYIGSVMDITERKISEEIIRESEESYRILAETASDAIIRIDTESRIQFVNSAAERIFGHSTEEMLGQSLTMLMPEDMKEAHRTGFRHYLETGERHLNWESIEVPARHKDGHLFPLEISFGEYNDDTGKRFFIGIARDVTERKRAEERLRESEEKFRTLADNMSQFAWMADETGWIFWYNRRWFEYTGTTLEEMQGWGWKKVHHPNHVERVVEKLKRHWESGEIWEDTFPLRSKSGEYRWFLSRALPIRNEKGEIVRWFGTNTDIEELRQAKIQAEQANRFKDEFLATVSHELRTPLNAILGWSAMARKSNYEPNVMRRAFEVIERNSRNQNQIISDILDVSRIITGKLNIEIDRVELPSVINAAIDTVRPAIEAKQINLRTGFDLTRREIPGDPDRLQQIVWNLLSNAVKFTPDGGEIYINLQYDERYAEITVADSGEGIEPDFLPFVFNRFRQADGKMNRKHGGLGLGLSIVRHLTELHGGSVSVENGGLGKGACFTVRLPLRIRKKNLKKSSAVAGESFDESNENSQAPKRLLENIKILVVDDEPDALQLAAFVLQEQGATVLTAQTVDKALEKLSQITPDAIVSDLGMPEKDGFYFIEKIKKTGVPTLALTAYAGKKDREQTLEAGFDAYLPKPADPNDLVEKLLEILPNPTSAIYAEDRRK